MNKMLDRANFKKMQAWEEELQTNKSAKAPVLYKTFACELKGLNADTRSFTAVASEESTDRMGDIIRVAGWQIQNYLKNPVVLWSHDYNIPSLGHALSLSIMPQQLLFEPSFATREQNPLADQIYLSYVAGHQRAFSVGFIPLKYVRMSDQDGYLVGYDITESELLEISCVNVPAHQNALTNGMPEPMGESIEAILESLKAEVAYLRQQMEANAKTIYEAYTPTSTATARITPTEPEDPTDSDEAQEYGSEPEAEVTQEGQGNISIIIDIDLPGEPEDEPEPGKCLLEIGEAEEDGFEIDPSLIAELIGGLMEQQLSRAMGKV